ncbi:MULTISPECIES: preATP grasp domain-containing protein [Micromonospora]|uniref:ATP-grasp domain-containing protein n=1 Tax=Micromonospora yangpuensis TaxID=683228 RepID=A0A1C6UNZ7_9ACTN|nr:ATP-grasp domain-containing protein [Micromonospora yangpuensis]GGM08961.1 phosphoribosylglycinamide formyltransferase 2 [Micromonospora yangpuensis]SCL55690.1 ATP-grasp domain-containing protein [Micromonospora yangpuensis]
MPPPHPTFLDGVRHACTGDAGTPFVLLGNFEVEDEWARDEVGLPTVGGRASAAIVNRMDEFAVLLAGPGDHVVLKSAPDADYLAWLSSLGIDLPNILVTDDSDPAATVSVDALRSPRLQATLRELAGTGAHLLPHGMSTLEERLCELTGLAPALPPAPVVKAVNSKIYSRRVAAGLGLPLAVGWECETVTEFAEAARQAARSVAAGRRVGVKDAYGVSGKGIVVVEDPRRLDQLVRMVTRRAEKTGDQRIGLVLEEWADKALDLNYHFTVGRDGTVRFDFVKEALTDNGVHKGHRIPARISAEHHAQLVAAAERLGARLAADGFHGVVGVDAITTGDGGLLPVLEINARNNMSTYQTSLQETFTGPDTVALARQYDLSLTRPVSFAALRDQLDDLLLTPERGTGLLVNNFATVNAAAPAPDDPRPYAGRLYGLLVAGSETELVGLDHAIAQILRKENVNV